MQTRDVAFPIVFVRTEGISVISSTINPSSAKIMRTIEAAVVRGSGHFHIESIEMEGPREDEVLVRIVGVGICHTDIDCCEGEDDPVVLGHEGAGVVEEVGKRVKGFRRGDHVVLSFQSCGRCSACRHGRPAHCEHFMELNFSCQRLDGTNAFEGSGVRGHFFGQSSFATHALATQRNLVKIPKGLPLVQLGPLGCGLQTGAGTVMNSLRVGPRSSLAIFGTGAVGLAAVMAARVLKAETIIAVDVLPKRLKLALELGATHAIDGRRPHVAAAIRRIVSNGVDYALEITGSDAVLHTALDALSARGTIAMIANPSEPRGLLKRGQKMLSIIQGDAVPQIFIPKLIKLFRAGKFPFDRLIRIYKFHDINRAVADAKRGRVIKPVLQVPPHSTRILA